MAGVEQTFGFSAYRDDAIGARAALVTLRALQSAAVFPIFIKWGLFRERINEEAERGDSERARAVLRIPTFALRWKDRKI